MTSNNNNTTNTSTNPSSNLLTAAARGDLTMVEHLLGDLVNRLADPATGRTALHFAAEKGHANVVTALLQRGADPNLVDQQGCTALHYACDCNLEEHGVVVNVLLQKENAIDTELKRKVDQKTALACALNHQAHTTAQKLIQYGASVRNIDGVGSTLLHGIVQHLRDFDTEIALFQEHLLGFPRENDKEDATATSTTNMIDINETDHQGRTILHAACHCCYHTELPRLVQFLLDHGATTQSRTRRSNKNDNDKTPHQWGATLLHALCNRHAFAVGNLDSDDANSDEPAQVIALLLQRDPTLLNVTDAHGFTALHEAILYGNHKSAMALLTFSEDDKNDDDDDTKNNNTHCINVNIATLVTGCTPLHMACDPSYHAKAIPSSKVLQLVQTLVQRGANLAARNSKGDTPLHLACRNNQNFSVGGSSFLLPLSSSSSFSWKLVKYLLLQQDNGATHALNWQGLNPLMTAAQANASLDLLFQMLIHTGGTALQAGGDHHGKGNANGTGSAQQQDNNKRSYAMAFVADDSSSHQAVNQGATAR